MVKRNHLVAIFLKYIIFYYFFIFSTYHDAWMWCARGRGFRLFRPPRFASFFRHPWRWKFFSFTGAIFYGWKIFFDFFFDFFTLFFVIFLAFSISIFRFYPFFELRTVKQMEYSMRKMVIFILRIGMKK